MAVEQFLAMLRFDEFNKLWDLLPDLEIFNTVKEASHLIKIRR